jgi:hypothetical protein
VAVFLFGHTHAAFLKRLGPTGPVIVNTGTWLKLLHRVPARLGLFPAIYSPSYYLGYFHILQENDQLVIRHVEVPKKPEHELTWLQRLLILGKKPRPPEPIPAKTVIALEHY